jgi:peroxiredoxin
VVQAYDVMYTPENRHREGFYGLAKRSVFVLDKEGIVRYAWVRDDALLQPDVEEVVGATRAASQFA